MQIAIDASRITVQRRTGTEHYALQMIRALLQLETPHHYHLFFRNQPAPDLLPPTRNYTAHVIPFPRLWTHLRFAAALWKQRPDVTWVPAHTLPRYFPGRAVVTVHDLGYLFFPQAHPERERRYLDWSTRHSVTRATLVMADSQATQNDLINRYQIPVAKIRVVYPGVERPPDTSADAADAALHRRRVQEKYQLPPRFLLFLGTLQPRKNIARLVQAFAMWQAESTHRDVVLILGGKKGWLYKPEWTEGYANVHLLGYVDDAEVSPLYELALGLVFPSLYEGFGFPVLEAMQHQLPVLCSNTSSLPELAGDAAILVDPLDVHSIAAGIKALVEDDALRQQLIHKGQAQAQKFRWQTAARSALKVLEEAARL